MEMNWVNKGNGHPISEYNFMILQRQGLCFF